MQRSGSGSVWSLIALAATLTATLATTPTATLAATPTATLTATPTATLAATPTATLAATSTHTPHCHPQSYPHCHPHCHPHPCSCGVVERRSRYQLSKAQERLHLVEGFLAVSGRVREVAEILATADSDSDASGRFVSQLGLSEAQARAVMDMPLRRLTK